MAQEKRIALRLPAWLLEAIDDEIERRRQKRRAAVINRSDVVREILARALVPRDRAVGDAPHP